MSEGESSPGRPKAYALNEKERTAARRLCCILSSPRRLKLAATIRAFAETEDCTPETRAFITFRIREAEKEGVRVQWPPAFLAEFAPPYEELQAARKKRQKLKRTTLQKLSPAIRRELAGLAVADSENPLQELCKWLEEGHGLSIDTEELQYFINTHHNIKTLNQTYEETIREMLRKIDVKIEMPAALWPMMDSKLGGGKTNLQGLLEEGLRGMIADYLLC